MISLEHARQRAKDLLAEARAGSAEALRRIQQPRPRLADAQRAIARELGYASWPRLVRDVEQFSLVRPEDLAWDRIRKVSIVCFRDDGQIVLFRRGRRWVTPSGRRLSGEDVWDDSVVRIPLECMGFRRQGTHLLAVDHDRRHCMFWVDGARYAGARPHRADAEWWVGEADEAAALLRDQGDGSLAHLVLLAAEARRRLTYQQHVSDLRRTLVGTYLRAPTPAGGSGFGGSLEDWRAARGMLADALDLRRERITFLDECCANGFLAASMVEWGDAAGVAVEPYGVDVAAELVARAKQLYPQWSDRFFVGDALTWRHEEGRRFDLVHMLLDVIPEDRQAELIEHLLQDVVAPGGRLLVSRYGMVQPGQSAEGILSRLGYTIDGHTRPPHRPGRPPEHPSVWIARPER